MDSNGEIINPKMIADNAGGLTEVQKAAHAMKLQSLKDEQARIAGEIVKGNKKPGPDWWPWSESNETQTQGHHVADQHAGGRSRASTTNSRANTSASHFKAIPIHPQKVSYSR